MTWALFLCACLAMTAGADKNAPHRVVNLDLPPAQRWTALATEFREPMRLTLDYVHNKSKSAIIAPIIDELKLALKTSGAWSKDWIQEMRGLAEAGDVDYSIVETANLFFEFDPGIAVPLSNTGLTCQHVCFSIWQAAPPS